MRKKTKYILIPLATVLVLLVLGFLRYRSLVYTPLNSGNTENISFQIKKGQTAKEIGKNLKEDAVIKSDLAFYLHTKFNNLGEGILSGRFVLNQSMNVPQILAILSDPSKAEYSITIQEGLTVKDIDLKLVELGLIKSGEFINEVKKFDGWEYYAFLNPDKLKNLDIPLEGYLYPDTYFLDPVDFDTHDLIYLALDNFEIKIAELNTGNKSLHEIVTMASIIENEVFGKEDRAIVSGILWKRLENGWTLGADATLLYIKDDRKITSEDLEIDSAYNTRKNLGLPPGPISSPSLESMEASSNPVESDYWFYLTSPDTGEVIYAKTNEEQNENREKYL